ncbi:MAG: penicillin-binding protein activator LpoB, partial [Treponema sp.]|nr:penicillin-binding protein activator LpoB [Treponema sp.]
MKKTVCYVIPVLMVLMGCLSGGKAAAETSGGSPGMNLDSAIKAAAAQMGENLPGGTKVAIVSVASSSAQLSEYIISRLEAALVNGRKLVVVDRANLDKIREEQGFQLSGEVDDSSAKSIGKLLGAGAIVTGGFADLGDVYSLTLKAINIETATVAVSYP